MIRRRNQRYLMGVALLLLGILTPIVYGQGLLVDARPGQGIRLPRPIFPPQPAPTQASSYRIESLEVNAKLSDSTARVQVSQSFKNTGSGQIEARFVFPLPYDGAIDQLTLLVDGKEYAATLLPKEEARKRYEEIVRTNRDPALLEWIGTGMFQTSVFPIPAGESRTVTLRYTQLCRKSHSVVDFLFPLSTAKYTDGTLSKLAVTVAIEAATDLKNIYSPSHEVKIERPDARHAVVKFEAKETIPNQDFRLFYDAGSDPVGASVVSYRPDRDEDGYFLLLATPELSSKKVGDLKRQEESSVAKTVLFIVDRSGSMSGPKMNQAKEALKFVLNNLHEGDLFNIVAYDSEVEAFRPELQKFSDENRLGAIGFVEGLFAGGSTNIDGALQRGLGMLQDSDRPSYVIFLTDGLPTVGETSEASIAKHAAAANKVRARLFPFGVGFDVNSRLLDKLSRDNHGRSEYVRPNENIETAVSALYRRIGAPVMTDVRILLSAERTNDDGTTIVDGWSGFSRLYPHGEFDLFAGDQAVVVGRYHWGGAAKATLRGKLNGKEQAFEFAADLAKQSDDDANAFVAKLWATRRVGEIIDEIDLKGRNEELVKELVELATRHGIITPYTSFLADENSARREQSVEVEDAVRSLGQLDAAEGEAGVQQRAAKGGLQFAARPASSAPAIAPAAAGDAFGAESLARLVETRGRGVAWYSPTEGRQVIAKTIITVGRKTFFRRGDAWVDSTVTEAEEKSAERIERFSQEYFDLAARYGRHVGPYLAIEEPVVVKLDGEVFAW